MEILQTSDDSGKLNSEERKMISAVFAFDDIVAYEIMTPRTDVFAIDIDADEDSYISELIKLKYTRIPARPVRAGRFRVRYRRYGTCRVKIKARIRRKE